MNAIIIKELVTNTTDLYSLLFLADPSPEQIEKYIHKSTIYGAYIDDGKNLVGVYVLYPINDEKVEIKNIAVKENYQQKGIGTLLLKHAIISAKEQGFRKIFIGTANSSIYQLYLYQKEGFNVDYIIKNFFIDYYDTPIIENCIQAKDMLMLVKNLY